MIWLIGDFLKKKKLLGVRYLFHILLEANLVQSDPMLFCLASSGKNASLMVWNLGFLQVYVETEGLEQWGLW